MTLSFLRAAPWTAGKDPVLRQPGLQASPKHLLWAPASGGEAVLSAEAGMANTCPTSPAANPSRPSPHPQLSPQSSHGAGAELGAGTLGGECCFGRLTSSSHTKQLSLG